MAPRDASSARPTEPHPDGEPGAATTDTFVGRENELQQLESALTSSDGRLILITGPAGIGKTRLAQEFAMRAALRGRRVIRGACWEMEAAPAFWPFVVVLRNHLAGDEVATNDVAAMEDLDDLLAQCLGSRPRRQTGTAARPGVDPQQVRFELFDRYASVLRDLAIKQPSVVIIDDIHWADASSLLLLQFLAGNLGEIPLVLVVTSRDPLPTLVSATCHHPWTQQIPLGGLNTGEARALLRQFAARLSERGGVDKLTALTDGNPFFLKELAQWIEDAPGELSSDWPRGLPPSLRGLTLRPFEGLSPTCRAILQTASVIGRDFDPDLVAEAVGQPAAFVLDNLQEAFVKRIVTPIGPTKYRFAHTLVREAVYEEIHLAQRARLHEQVAHTLERRGGSGTNPRAAIAHHYFLSLPLVARNTALRSSIAAGREAHEICAYEDAVLYFQRALQLTDRSTHDTERCELLLLLGAAQAASGNWLHSRHTFRQASTIARRIDDPSYLSRAAIGFKGAMLATIPVDQDAIILLEEACERARHHDSLLVELFAALTGSLHFSDDSTLSEKHTRKALSLAKRLGDERLRAIAVQARALSLWRPEHVTKVVALSADLTRLAARLGDPLLEFQAAIFRHSSLAVLGKIAESDRELLRAAHLADSTRHPRLQWQVTVIQRARALARGDIPEAERLTLNTRALGEKVHDTTPAHYEMIYNFQRALLDDTLAHWPDIARAALERFPTVIGYRAAIALIYARLGLAADTRRHLQYFAGERFLNIPSNSASLWLLSMLGEASILYGDSEWIQALYDRLSDYAVLNISVAWGVLLDGSVSHYLGLMASALGEREQARAHFEQALSSNSLLNAPILLARTQIMYARFLHFQCDQSARALQLIRLARPMFESCGFLSYARQAADLSEHVNASPNALAYGSSRRATRNADPPYASENILRRNGDFWLLAFQGGRAYIRHCIGLEYIKSILSAAGSSLHVLDLYRGGRSPSADLTEQEISDLSARRSYERRMVDIQKELQVAESDCDLGGHERLTHELEILTTQLSKAYGFGGRPRSFPSAIERARINVRNRLSTALGFIRRQNEPAYQHLSRSIRTGRLCSYQPEFPTVWTF